MGLPALKDTAQYSLETLNNLSHYHQLTENQKSILFFTIEGITSDLNYTDAEIADFAGVSRSTVTYTKHNAHFLACQSEYTKQHAKGNIPSVIRALEKKAMEGSVRAQELLMRYTGDYIPTQRNQNANIDLNKSFAGKLSTNSTMLEVMSEIVASLCDLGWHIEKVKAVVNENLDLAYQKLQSEGRIPQTQTQTEQP